jgi:hypothetical protein
MGYNWKDLKKGGYKDGHERKDVVNYRVIHPPPPPPGLRLPASSLDGSGDSEVPYWIELDRVYWSACKYFAQRRCNYSFASLREIAHKALESASPSLVQKYWARSKRILNSQCAGAVYGDGQFRENVIARSQDWRRNSLRGATMSGNLNDM